MSWKVSQSLMKAFVDYLNGKECGIFFKARYIDKDPDARTEPSEAMKAGVFFEYQATGAKNRDGSIPQAEYAYKGTAREKITAPYERALESAKIFKRLVSDLDIKILEVGKYLANDKMNGILDILAEWKNRLCVIDLKYTGLINDKWNELGWDIDSLHLKESIMVQPVHYKILGEDVLGIKDIPFYFFVFSSTNPNDIKIIDTLIDESRIASHRVAVDEVISRIGKEMKYGFKPLASLSKCSDCPLAFKCSHKSNIPIIEQVAF